MPFCWSWSGDWKRGANRIREHWFWVLRHLLDTSKCTFMSWLLNSLDLASRRKDTHRLMSRLDYGFNQWSDVSLVIKKLYVHLFMVKLYIFSYTHVLHASIFSPFIIWEKTTDFVVFLNFLSTLHAAWIIKKCKRILRVKIRLSLKTNDVSLTISSNLLYFNFTKSR